MYKQTCYFSSYITILISSDTAFTRQPFAFCKFLPQVSGIAYALIIALPFSTDLPADRTFAY